MPGEEPKPKGPLWPHLLMYDFFCNKFSCIILCLERFSLQSPQVGAVWLLLPRYWGAAGAGCWCVVSEVRLLLLNRSLYHGPSI